LTHSKRIAGAAGGLLLALAAVAGPAILAAHHRGPECPGQWAALCRYELVDGRP